MRYKLLCENLWICITGEFILYIGNRFIEIDRKQAENYFASAMNKKFGK